MNILFVGDASGVAVVLKRAFEKMGHSCKIIAFSNPQRRACIESAWKGGGMARKVFAQFRFLSMVMESAENADWVVSVGYVWLSNLMNLFPWLGWKLIEHVRKHAKRLSYLALGCDPLFASSGSEYCQACRRDPDSVTRKCDILYRGQGGLAAQTINDLYDDFIIMTPDYDTVFVDTKIKRYIPLPFEVESREQAALLRKDDPILIVHASTGRNRKGSKFILQAMERFESQYSGDVKCVVLEGLEYKGFRRRLAAADIVIDQCHSRSYGMLALEALALGKVVLSGGETFPEYQDQCPVIDIRADVDDICDKLEEAMNVMRDPEYAQKHCDYVKKVHHSSSIAVKMVQLYGNVSEAS